jgi:diaminopimelate epimerase
VTAVGAALQAEHPDGVNVEFIAPVGDGELTLRVFERGVGETLACGTGSCAAAAAANDWGLVGGRVRVHNPGGALDVDLGDGSSVEMWGPVRKVADVTVDLDSIL